MSLWDKFGKPRIIAGHLYKPGLIEQFLAQPVEKNEGHELREQLLRALKAVGPDDFYGNEAPVMLGRADINEAIAILESGKDLNEAFGSTKPTHRETGSGNRGEVAAEITRQLAGGKSVKQVGKELNRQPSDVRKLVKRYPQVVLKTLADGLVLKLNGTLVNGSFLNVSLVNGSNLNCSLVQEVADFLYPPLRGDIKFIGSPRVANY